MVSRPWLNPPRTSKNQLLDSMNPRKGVHKQPDFETEAVLFAELLKALTSADRDEMVNCSLALPFACVRTVACIVLLAMVQNVFNLDREKHPYRTRD